VKHIEFDISLLGDCDHVVTELCRRAGWSFQHAMIPDNFKADVEQNEEKPYETTVRLATA
jgi:NAD+-dependent protein deacetylase SIR2